MDPKNADGMANNLVPNQIYPSRAADEGIVWLGSALFAQISMSQYFYDIQSISPIFYSTVDPNDPIRLMRR